MTRQPARQLRILLVHSDPTVLDESSSLAPDDLKILHATSRKTALGILNDEFVDIAYIHLHLQDCDGFQLMNEIIRRWPHVIGVFIGNPTEITEATHEHHEFQEFQILVEPFHPEQFMETLNRAIAQSHKKERLRKISLHLESVQAKIKESMFPKAVENEEEQE